MRLPCINTRHNVAWSVEQTILVEDYSAATLSTILEDTIMRTIAIFLCCLCFVTYTLVRADDEPPRVMCLAKMGMTRDDVPSLLTDDSDEAVRKRGCLEACFMQKIGIMEGNTINMDKIHADIDKILANSDQTETVHQSIHQCATDAADADECIVAQKFAKCGLEYLKLRL